MNQVIDGVLIASAAILLGVTLYLRSLTRVRLKRLSVRALPAKDISEPLAVREASKKEAASRASRPSIRRAVTTAGAILARVLFAIVTVLAIVGIIGTVGLFVVYLAGTIAQRVFLPQVSLDLIIASGIVTLVMLGGVLLWLVSANGVSGRGIGASARSALWRSLTRPRGLPTSFEFGASAPLMLYQLRANSKYFLDEDAWSWDATEVLPGSPGRPGPYRFQGSAILPKRVYEGDSHGISIDLHRVATVDPDRPDYLTVGDDGTLAGPTRGDVLQRDRIDTQLHADFLEAELVTAGMGDIAGATTQRQPVSAERLTFYWNCRFSHSGTHTFEIFMWKVSINREAQDATNGATPRETKELLRRIEHTATVVRLDHMTKRQVKVLATLFGFVGAVSGMTGVAKTALEVGHHFGWW